MSIKWRLIGSLSGEDEHLLKYAGNYKGKEVALEVCTPVKSDVDETGESIYHTHEFGEPEVIYYIEGDEREFNTEEELIRAVEFEE